jgi:uncharacterized protein YndB with AHSA1/START domain
MTEVIDLSFECDLDAPPEQVWRALTTPELRAAWLGERESEACETIEAAPPERLVVRWSLDEPPNSVTFDIEPREAGSRLTITHRPAAALAEVVQLRPRPAQTVMCAPTWKMAA